MQHFLSIWRTAGLGLTLVVALVAGSPAHAQTTPAWQAALAPGQGFSGQVTVQATAVNAAGDVFVTGYFSGQVAFGTTALASAGPENVFVAKWNTAASAWAWATAAGGRGHDRGQGIAVSGTSIYLTGRFANNSSNANAVQFGGTPLNGTSNVPVSQLPIDVFVAKYTDAGSSAAFGWATAGGGAGSDEGNAIAVSGTSVYVTGAFSNTNGNGLGVQFGGLALSAANNGNQFRTDVFVVKYTDTGGSAVATWAVAGGGDSSDQGSGIAVSGTSVYVTGSFFNSSGNSARVQFGGTTLAGASSLPSSDVFVAKYTDAGSSATYGWAAAGGGTDNDFGSAIAANGANVYLTGTIASSTTSSATGVRFGGVPLNGSSSTSNLGNYDAFVAKYTDAGSSATYGWATAGGGSGFDFGQGIAVSGTGVYVTGTFTNSSTNAYAAQFGGTPLNGTTGVVSRSSTDLFAVKYTDTGSSPALSWATAGGDANSDEGRGIAVSSARVQVVGAIGSTATFGAAGALVGPNAVRLSLDPATGAWLEGATPEANNASSVQGTAVNAAGDVFVTGTFSGRVAFGGTTLNSAGGADAFVAKWSAAANAWAWAVAGGGRGTDEATGIAVSGTGVYVTGRFTNNGTNTNAVQFGGTPLNGTASGSAGSGRMPGDTNYDVFVVKYTDAGSSATYGWATAGGGNDDDAGQGIAVSGTSVYVTGGFTNTSTNASAVQFGGTTLNGMDNSWSTQLDYDVFVVKYTDAGSSAAFGWATAGGGSGRGETGMGIAVSGTSVYVTGTFANDDSNGFRTRFAGVTLYGMSYIPTNDVFVAKYTDAGSSVANGWAVAGGGYNGDQGNAIAVSGTSVYITGSFYNSSSNARGVRFGGLALNGASSGVSQDVFVAKYTDAGSSAAFGWATAGGGRGYDQGRGIAASGANVYVTGYTTNTSANANAVQFGGVALSGTGSTDSPDVFVAQYTDAGSSVAYGWAIAAGGPGNDQGTSLAVSGTRVWVGGALAAPASFGSRTLGTATTSLAFVAALGASTGLPTRAPAALAAGVAVYPNPAHDVAHVRVPGVAGVATVQAELLNVLGQAVRPVAAAALPATGAELRLPTAGLAPGVYVLRLTVGAATVNKRIVLD